MIEKEKYKAYYARTREKRLQKTKHNCGGTNSMQVYQLENKKSIREAANHTCQRCGKIAEGKQLHIHHIIPSEMLETRNDEQDNLVCLCNSCHQSLHHILKEANTTSFEAIKEITEAFVNKNILTRKEELSKIASNKLYIKERSRTKKLDLKYTADLLKDNYKKQLVIVDKLKEQKKRHKKISVEKWRISNMEYKKALKDALEIQNEWHKALQMYKEYKITGE